MNTSAATTAATTILTYPVATLNASTNGTSMGNDPPVTFWIFLSLETLVTIIGNATLVWLFGTNKKLRTNQNLFIVSLSMGDLLVGLSVAPCEYCRINPYLPYCPKFCGSIISFNMLSSVVNLCLIAADRYLSIKKPFLYVEIFTKKRALLAITVTWTTTIVLTSLPMSWFDLKDEILSNTINMAYSGLLFALTIAAGIGLAVSYFIIVTTIRSKIKSSKEAPSNPAGVQVCIISSVIFFVSWLPYVVVELYVQDVQKNTTNPSDFPQYLFKIMDVSYFVLLLSPCFDPLLYAYYRRDFRSCLVLCYQRNFSCLGELYKRTKTFKKDKKATSKNDHQQVLNGNSMKADNDDMTVTTKLMSSPDMVDSKI